jgi:putative heme-binding domain-containing protein
MSLMRLVSFLVFIVPTLLQAAIEPWADSALPVKDGVALWLDATREQAARDYQKQPLVIPGNGLDVWHDGSGFGRDVVQPITSHRPRFAMSGSNAVVMFDGQNHFLYGHTPGVTASNVSVFLFAAPRSNSGVFRAFISMSAAGKNDYQSGLNVDLGGKGSDTWKTLNVEGLGASGESNLMTNPAKFGVFHALSIVSESGGDTTFFLDGNPQGHRTRKAGAIAMDEIAIGARHYSHEAEAPFVDNFVEADLAEVIIYNRALSSEERASVERYLAAKHRALQEGQLGGQVWLKPVANPPPVQMLVPGFAVRELPVQLNNINNLRYRRDGKLFAVGYDGVIWLLSDTDGDGLEDKAEPFWDQPTLRVPLGIALTPPNYQRGDGVFVPAFNKLALLVDTNRDDRADDEIIIATGWPEAFHNADAMGVTLDKEGNIYFGLGIGLSFANAYRLDKEGNGHYDLDSERGTIYKVSADFSRREKLVTGIRFPVALAFNRNGDLFCTEQEGATWLANGNPFDELLHIQPGRHYGFPPRHPRHLPNVIDEPSVFDYRPQHQSTCGFVFNEPVNGGPVFGPDWWTEDAIVTGESRGKLWRTKLTKTAAGYVAQNQLIGCLSALTIDATVSPKGHLVVCTHGGKPDWGTGPKGQGRIFQIQYVNRSAPQPVMAWNAGPDEFRVSFDRPLQATELRELTKKTSITRGKYVSPGDRFETMRPGYQVVQNELSTPRFDVPVLGANLSSDGQTLIFRTPPQRAAMNYALKIGGLRKEAAKTGELRQHADVDVIASMNGVEATWKDSSGSVTWSGWLPHLDPAVSRDFLSASRPHLPLWESIKKNGTLGVRCQLNLWQMLQPAVQPGGKLDYVPPAEHVTVTVRANANFRGKTSQGGLAVKREGTGYIAAFEHTPKEDEWLPLELELVTSGATPKLEIVWHTSEDSRERAFPLRRFMLPWALPDKQSGEEPRREIPELAGGNWLRGEQVFFSEQAACSRCHQARGKGGGLGPDLSNLVHRDYASVMKDILEPSAAINPDHLAYQVELNDGDVLSGVIVTDTPAEIALGDSSGATIAVDRKRIRNIKPSALSIMPEGLLTGLTAQSQKDLLTFLLFEAPAATAASTK